MTSLSEPKCATCGEPIQYRLNWRDDLSDLKISQAEIDAHPGIQADRKHYEQVYPNGKGAPWVKGGEPWTSPYDSNHNGHRMWVNQLEKSGGWTHTNDNPGIEGVLNPRWTTDHLPSPHDGRSEKQESARLEGNQAELKQMLDTNARFNNIISGVQFGEQK